MARRKQTYNAFTSGAVRRQRQGADSVKSTAARSRINLHTGAVTTKVLASAVSQTRTRGQPGQIKSEQDSCSVYATDEAIGRKLFGDKDWKTFVAIVPTLEREGLPPRRALFLNRRHLPAVLQFLEQRETSTYNGSLCHGPVAIDGHENFD